MTPLKDIEVLLAEPVVWPARTIFAFTLATCTVGWYYLAGSTYPSFGVIGDSRSAARLTNCIHRPSCMFAKAGITERFLFFAILERNKEVRQRIRLTGYSKSTQTKIFNTNMLHSVNLTCVKNQL